MEPVCAAAAEAAGLTLVDLSDDWTPRLMLDTPDKPHPYRSTYLALAGGQTRRSAGRVDRHFELFGIFPTLSVVRQRLLDENRHVCHDQVEDRALAGLRGVLYMSGPTREPLRQAIRAVQAHLRCAGLLARARDGVYDAATSAAVREFQILHMIPDRPGVVDPETRAALLTDSRELDFRALLRVLRERVADAAGLIEDGSAAGSWQPVLDRFIDSAEYRTVSGLPPLEGGAPDLIARATQAAAVALGWTSPAAATRFFANHGPPLLAVTEGVATRSPPVPTSVALKLPPLPEYHSPHMDLRAVIDRGDGSRPRRRPTLVLLARHGGREIPLVRWPTTIGGWQDERLPDGRVVRAFKDSPLGAWLWRDLYAAPAWLPPPTTPDRELVIRQSPARWAPNLDAVGPGHRSAYGLMALVHHRPSRRIAEDGSRLLVDTEQIRTHGSGSYRSILRGESHGCHRLFNHLAVRLGSFLLRHRAHVRHGMVTERYGRTVELRGHRFVIRASGRGYRYELTPPVPVATRRHADDLAPARTDVAARAPRAPAAS